MKDAFTGATFSCAIWLRALSTGPQNIAPAKTAYVKKLQATVIVRYSQQGNMPARVEQLAQSTDGLLLSEKEALCPSSWLL